MEAGAASLKGEQFVRFRLGDDHQLAVIVPRAVEREILGDWQMQEEYHAGMRVVAAEIPDLILVLPVINVGEDHDEGSVGVLFAFQLRLFSSSERNVKGEMGGSAVR